MTQPENTALKDALDIYVQQEGLRPLSRRTGIPLGVIRAIVEGRDVSGTNLRIVTEKLGLEFYIGPKRQTDPAGSSTVHEGHEDDVALVDRFNLEVSAGSGSLGVASATSPAPFSASWLRRRNLRPSELSALEVRGDSMEPILYNGDPILVDKHKSSPKSGQMYVVVRGDSVQVKWVMVHRDGVQLVSENRAYAPERIDQHEAPDFYRVRWFAHFVDG